MNSSSGAKQVSARAWARRYGALRRRLEKEAARRKVVEESLRQSERQAGLALAQSRLLQEQLRQLSRRILSAQEDERKRISRELHDLVAQSLTGIHVRLATLKKEAASNAQGLGRKISSTQRLVEKSAELVHRFALELRPAVLDDLGLIPALHSFLKGFAKETGIRVRLTAFAGVEKLSNAKRTVLYRVAQEALTNVARHAQAGRVEVCLQKLAGNVLMRVQDDGKSFDVEKMWRLKRRRRLGLLGMRERVEMVGGVFRIESAPERGTAILVRLPFREGTKESGSQ